jgi:hypothetical protein
MVIPPLLVPWQAIDVQPAGPSSIPVKMSFDQLTAHPASTAHTPDELAELDVPPDEPEAALC